MARKHAILSRNSYAHILFCTLWKVLYLISMRKNGLTKICPICNTQFYRPKCLLRIKTCSKKCGYINKRGKSVKHSGQFKKGFVPWNKGKKQYPHVTEAVIKSVTGNTFRRGKVLSEETKHKISASRKGKATGVGNPKWIKDRTKVKKSRHHAYDTEYKIWMRKVKNRDDWKCQISNSNCSGLLEAHHILPWAKFPELRYELNNGITLCRFHHPRKRDDEEKLASLFKTIVADKAVTFCLPRFWRS